MELVPMSMAASRTRTFYQASGSMSWSGRSAERLTVGSPLRGGSLLRQERAAGGGEVLLLRLVHLRVLEVEGREGVDDRRGDDDAGEPLVVGGDDVPRGGFGGGVADHVLVRL